MPSAPDNTDPVGPVAQSVGRRAIQPSTPKNVYYDDSGTTSVRYIDMSAHKNCIMKIHSDQAMRFLWVESATPDTTPTTTDVAVNEAGLDSAVMNRAPADFVFEEPVHPKRPVLAYILAAAGGVWASKSG